MTDEQALEAAGKIYQRLLSQGRPEADARRDAERWVSDTWDIAVTLPAPLPYCQACGVGHEPGHPDCAEAFPICPLCNARHAPNPPSPKPPFVPNADWVRPHPTAQVWITWTAGGTSSSTSTGFNWGTFA